MEEQEQLVIKIYKKDDYSVEEMAEFIGQECFFVNSYSEYEEIVNFFNIYDYRTLDKKDK